MLANIIFVCLLIKSIASECVVVNSSATCTAVYSITEIPLNDTRTLTIDNNFQELSLPSGVFAGAKKLKKLKIKKCDFKKLFSGTFNRLPLTHIALTNNTLEEVKPGAFGHLPKLQQIDLGKNKIGIIRRGVFSNLTVTSIKLSENQISTIEDNAFENLPNLTKLLINGNQLESVFVPRILDHPETLEILWFYQNSLTTLSNYMLQGLSNLKLLNLGFNRITSIEEGSFEQTPKLETLVLTNNNLKELDGLVFPRNGHNHLDKLYLDNNELMFLPTSFFVRLNVLRLITLVGNPWQCECLDIVHQTLRENSIEEKCQAAYIKGNRPICVSGNPGDRCRYSYNEQLATKFLEYKRTHPLHVRAIDCFL